MPPLLKETVKSFFAANDTAYKLLFRAYFWSGKHLPVGRVAAKGGKDEATFTSIYRSNGWDSSESRSGIGSTLASTANIRRRLPNLLERLNIRALLDAPCGDFHWMKEVPLPAGCTYIGADIVPDLIEDLSAQFASPSRSFVCANILGPLPDADLWLCRDCLIHLSNEQVATAIENFQRSNIGYWLTTHVPACRTNKDIPTGAYRLINLRRPPFNLPKPLAVIDDFVPPAHPKQLALWSHEQLTR